MLKNNDVVTYNRGESPGGAPGKSPSSSPMKSSLTSEGGGMESGGTETLPLGAYSPPFISTSGQAKQSFLYGNYPSIKPRFIPAQTDLEIEEEKNEKFGVSAIED
jgi:hypothetical protein